VFEVALKILIQGIEQRSVTNIADDLTQAESTEAMG
jgi:hypothetical protein